MSTGIKMKSPVRGLDCSRVLGTYGGHEEGPVMVVCGGIHGNELGGVIAVRRLLRRLQDRDIPMKGRLVCLAGNLAGLQVGARYIDHDLNRMWRREHLTGERGQEYSEYQDFTELNQQIHEAAETANGPIFFIACIMFGPFFGAFIRCITMIRKWTRRRRFAFILARFFYIQFSI